MSDFTKLAKEVVKIAKTKRDKKPSSFDTEGKVNRIDRDNKIAWVKFAEGEDETPVQMTIDVVPGDKVRIRESGHKAWIAGNVTHPPTDATRAINYINASVKSINAKFENTENQIGDINTEIEDLKHKVVVKVVTEHCFATARSIPAGGDFDDIKAEGYDWTEEELEYPTGLSYTLYYWVRTVTYYSDGSSEISGPVFDVSAQVSKEAKDVGNAAKEVADTVTEDLESLENYFWNTDTDGVYVANKKDLTESSVNVRSNTIVIRRDGKIASNYAASGINFYDGKGSSTITDDLLASYTRSGINLYTKNAELSPVNKNSRAASFTPSGLTLWDPSDNSNDDNQQRKEAIFGSSGVYLYGTETGGGVTRNPLLASFTTSGISFSNDYDMTIGSDDRFIKWHKDSNSLEIVTDSLYIGGNIVQPTSLGSILRSGYPEQTWLTFSSIGYEDEWTNGDNGYDTGKIPYPIPKDSTITINGYATDSGNYWQIIGRVTQTTTSGNIPTITIGAESNPRGESGGTTDSQYMTYNSSFGLRVYSGPKSDPTFAKAYTQIKSTGITLVKNSNGASTGTETVVASFGDTAQIGPTSGNHFVIANNKLQGWSNSTNMFFEVSASGMTYGNNVQVATTTQVDAKSDKSSTVSSTVSVYYRSTTNSTPSINSSTSIGTSATTDNAWEYVMPQPKRDRYFYTCEKYTLANGTVSFSTVRALASETYASKWCSSSDNTYIDGGKIYANSITASQIAANTITATQINTSTLQLGESQITNLTTHLGQKADASSVPTKTSQLTNDSNYTNTTQLDNAKNEAKQTATNYIGIETNGIKIGKDVATTTSYALITSSGLNIYKQGTSVAEFGSSTDTRSRIGPNNGTHINVNTNEIGFYTNATTKPLALTLNAAGGGRGLVATGSTVESKVALDTNFVNLRRTEGDITDSIGISTTGYCYMSLYNNATDTTLAEVKLTSSGFTASNIDCGSVSISTTTAGSPASANVTFHKTFPSAPKVVITASTSVPGTRVTGVGAESITTTGFKAWVTRTNTGNTTLNWIAMS